jgi:hypothetical protein
MRELYRRKGGTLDPVTLEGDTYMGEEFNSGQGVELTLDDLAQLERDIRALKLPITKGFFFGQSDIDEETQHRDLAFVWKARTAIAEGYHVFYTSWW